MSEDATEMQDLYRELILDHARQPRNFKRLADATHSAEGINPLCGDKLHLYLVVDQDKITEISFQGSGCAISMASASLLTETVAERSVADAVACVTTVTRRLTTGKEEASATFDLGKLRALDGVTQYPSRVKCATLAWHALRAALNQAGAPATTE
ncbi:MAG: SUF system NifU family Fe-S cluster assembly protein [Gammaproteobacteria bacterium]|nr:SUF system NifU family Fe-S cluster assembly protein [Gammaproteobacteria bacterium]